jgi:hypothetical protein
MSSIRRALRHAARLFFIHRFKGPMEEIVAHTIAFAIFSADDPIAGHHVGEPEIRGDCFCFPALPGFNCDRSENAK